MWVRKRGEKVAGRGGGGSGNDKRIAAEKWVDHGAMCENTGWNGMGDEMLLKHSLHKVVYTHLRNCCAETLNLCIR